MEPKQPHHRPPVRRYPESVDNPAVPRRPIHVQSQDIPQHVTNSAPVNNQQSYSNSSDPTISNNSPSVQQNLHHTNNNNQHTTTSHNIQHKIKNHLRKFKSLVRVIIRKLRKILHPVWLRLKKLPWKIIGTVLATTLFVFAIVFHFYIASPARIIGTFEKNLESAQKLEDEIRSVSSALSKIPPFSTDTSTAQDALTNLESTASNSTISLPPRFVTNYALRGYSDTAATVDVLYQYENSSEAIADLSRDTATLLDMTSQLFGKKVDVNTQEYIDFTKQTIILIEEIDNDNQELSTATILRIYRQILESAEQYQVNEDLDNFNFQTSNVASELYKEIYTAWNTPMIVTLTGVSAQRSSLESIVNTVE